MLLAAALALLITGCAQQTFTDFKQTGSGNCQKPSPSFLRFLEVGRRKLSMQQNLWRHAENVVKNRSQQTFVNGLLGFITLGIYTPLEAH